VSTTEQKTSISADQPSAGDGSEGLTLRRRKRWYHRLLRNPSALIGVIILVLVAILAIVAPFLWPNPNTQSLIEARKPPGSPDHLLGTDDLGRDMLARMAWGAQVPLIVSLAAVFISGTLGVALGLLSGYYRGFLDDVIGWLANVQLAFPFILLSIAVVAVIGPGILTLILVIGFTSWVVYSRVVRGETLALREKEFVEASRAIGVRTSRILLRHILPNVMTSLTVIATFEVARIIILESALSFLGLGVDSKTPSWGEMLARGKQQISVAWWMPTFPGIAIMLTVLAVNLVGDWLREEFDPRLQV
jgi:peptide/nickel transport system permease protein